jgi:hypothetical protein
MIYKLENDEYTAYKNGDTECSMGFHREGKLHVLEPLETVTFRDGYYWDIDTCAWRKSNV